MQKDIRETARYQEAEAIHTALRQPGTGQFSDAAEVNASRGGQSAVFAGTIADSLDGTFPTRIGLTNLITGDTRVLTFGPNVDRLPKFSPDGRQVAFLSDRGRSGDFQLYLLDLASGAARRTPCVEGWVEYLQWSPDGSRILLVAAGHGADISGGQGAVTSKQVFLAFPPWMPKVECSNAEVAHRWRRGWVYELDTCSVLPVTDIDTNIWEAVWCGNDALVAVVSSGPGEELWYSANLVIVDIGTGNSREVHKPTDQLGWPAASPSGTHIAIVEALSSDRWVVAGDLLLIHSASGKTHRVATSRVDITYTEWLSEHRLLLAGHRGDETVVSLYDVTSEEVTEMWSSRDITTGGTYVTVSGANEAGDCVLVGESFLRAPEIAVIRRGEYRCVKSFDLGYAEQVEAIETVECVSWKSDDGLEMQGWLLRPKGKGPFPLVMNVHGGPVALSRPRWLGRSGVHFLMLLRQGFLIFFPNPRGSSGYGQAFAAHIKGELGGAETTDHLAGLDFLVDAGLADPARLGVTGISHGGYMTCWLITQDKRFAAAVAVSPVTNFVTQHFLSNIPAFVDLFLADKYNNPRGKYFERSPLMHAHMVQTPTLNICGALDRCTPPEEAVQFHNALQENHVKSALITYPEEGHGVRQFPAVIDYAARLVVWFEEHMSSQSKCCSQQRH